MKKLILIFFLFSGYAYPESVDFKQLNFNLNHWVKIGYEISHVNAVPDSGIIYTLEKGGLLIGNDGLLENIGTEVILCYVDISNKNTRCYKP
jgi:hypothetical protein